LRNLRPQDCWWYPELAIAIKPWWRELPVEFLLQLMRISHAILGITPAKPEHERAFLLAWIVSLLLIIAVATGLLMLLMPRIIR
jgi:hypothetical protein